MMPEGFPNIEDLLADASFCNCLQSDRHTNQRYWNNYLTRHPRQTEMLQESDEIVKRLAVLEHYNTSEVDHVWRELRNHLFFDP
jgi:hypothetical protein